MSEETWADEIRSARRGFHVMTERGVYVGAYPIPPGSGYDHPPEILALIAADKVTWAPYAVSDEQLRKLTE